jgi:CheY-like chemotaxis protein
MEDDCALQKCGPRIIRAALGDDVIVDVTDSVPKAIALLQHFRYDAIISDFMVEWGTGIDLLKWVREERPALVDKFVFFTGDNNDVKKEHTKVIDKAIRLDDFVAQLRAHLASGAAA